MALVFGDFDLTDFWNNSGYAIEKYVSEPPTDALVALVEQELGYRLPHAYVELTNAQNGGMVKRARYPMAQGTSWAADHVTITGIYGIGRTKPYSLCGLRGSKFWMQEWRYPPIGVYFADCPSAGHDMFCLDYRACGPNGEPSVVHIDQESGFVITPVARDFETFIRGLRGDEVSR